MLNTRFTSIQHSLIKILSSAVIILGLFSFAPAANPISITPFGDQTEQLITKGAEKVFYFYHTYAAPKHGITNIIYRTILKSYNSIIIVQCLRNKVNIYSLDQRTFLKHFTQHLSVPEDYLLNRV
ncbi:MAG: hypothetical protein WAU36_02665 [Cyclobacteriaceae bacterium]